MNMKGFGLKTFKKNKHDLKLQQQKDSLYVVCRKYKSLMQLIIMEFPKLTSNSARRLFHQFNIVSQDWEIIDFRFVNKKAGSL